jgi:hypothetical protein
MKKEEHRENPQDMSTVLAALSQLHADNQQLHADNQAIISAISGISFHCNYVPPVNKEVNGDKGK